MDATAGQTNARNEPEKKETGWLGNANEVTLNPHVVDGEIFIASPTKGSGTSSKEAEP